MVFKVGDVAGMQMYVLLTHVYDFHTGAIITHQKVPVKQLNMSTVCRSLSSIVYVYYCSLYFTFEMSFEL